MHTKRTIESLAALAVLAIASMVSACASNDPKPSTTPIAGTLTGTVTEPCGDVGSRAPVTVDAVGELSGVGPVTLRIDETAICAAFGMLERVTDIVGVYTTDNGDELRFTGTGSEVHTRLGGTPSATYSADDQFSGGTGRYADATGEERVTVSYNPYDKSLTVTVDGEVTTTG